MTAIIVVVVVDMTTKVDIVASFTGSIFVNEILYRFTGVIKLVERIAKDWFFAIIVKKGIATTNAIVLLRESIKQVGQARVIGQHETGNLVAMSAITFAEDW